MRVEWGETEGLNAALLRSELRPGVYRFVDYSDSDFFYNSDILLIKGTNGVCVEIHKNGLIEVTTDSEVPHVFERIQDAVVKFHDADFF